MKTSRRYPSGNVNFLHDVQVRDRFTGMPVYNGTPCRIGVVTRAEALEAWSGSSEPGGLG